MCVCVLVIYIKKHEQNQNNIRFIFVSCFYLTFGYLNFELLI